MTDSPGATRMIGPSEDELAAIEIAVERVAGTATSVLEGLQRRVGMSSWVLARTEGADLRVVATVQIGDRAPLTRLVTGEVLRWWRPLLAAALRDGTVLVPDVAGRRDLAPGPGDPPLGAAVASSLVGPGGETVGLLLGADLDARPEGLEDLLQFVEVVAALLAALLEAEVNAARHARRAEAATVDSLRDALTGLGNRRLWDRLLTTEEERCRRNGSDASVVVIDLDGLKRVNDEDGHAAGDALIRRAALVLHGTLRTPDVVTRVGGDEFAVVATDCGEAEAAHLVARLRDALGKEDIEASVGCATRSRTGTLEGAWRAADVAMYDHKDSRRAGRAAG